MEKTDSQQSHDISYLKSIEADIELLKQKLQTEKDLYVEKYREFKNGDKVIVTQKDGMVKVGFVVEAMLTSFYEIRYNMVEPNKKGDAPGRKRIYHFYDSIVTPYK